MNQKTIYALGFFDGVHLGHQALLKACCQLAQQHGCQAGVITFAAHPDGLVLGKLPALLNTSDDRTRLLYAYGVDIVREIPFDKALMTTHWSSFLQQPMADDAAGFVCGDDFRFGSGALGTAKKLAAFCEKRALPYAIVPAQTMDGQRISSTRIRALLKDGQIEQATDLMDHPHVLTGKVVSGRQLGRTLGFPTANLVFPEGLLIPKLGVYVCVAAIDGEVYLSVANIGNRPTVDGKTITVEAHILDFDGDLYGKELTLAFCKFLRPEKKFDTVEELKAQIAEDIAQLRAAMATQQ